MAGAYSSSVMGLQRLLSSAGLQTPMQRGVAVGAATAILLHGVKPGFAFHPDGTPRPFAPLSPASVESGATMAPWWLVSGALGLMASSLL